MSTTGCCGVTKMLCININDKCYTQWKATLKIHVFRCFSKECKVLQFLILYGIIFYTAVAETENRRSVSFVLVRGTVRAKTSWLDCKTSRLMEMQYIGEIGWLCLIYADILAASGNCSVQAEHEMRTHVLLWRNYSIRQIFCWHVGILWK